MDLDNQYDFCISFGVLGYRTKAQMPLEYFATIVDKLWKYARHAVCFNVLTPLADFTHVNHIRPSFEEVLNIVTEFTPRFVLYHDYMRYEYLIIMQKSFELDANKIYSDNHT